MSKQNSKVIRDALLQLPKDVTHTFQAYFQAAASPDKVVFTNIRLVDEAGDVGRTPLVGHLNFPKSIVERMGVDVSLWYGRKICFKGRVATYNHWGTTRGTLKLATELEHAIQLLETP